MPIDPNTAITITAYDWVPDFAKGHVRDMRVRWALEEVGLAYRVHYLAQGEQKQPEHRCLQPFGQVPTFQENDLTLFESGAIVLHVGTLAPGLLPDDAAGRARATEWVFAALNTVELPVIDIAIATLFERDKPWSEPRIPAIRGRIAQRLEELAARLGDRDWLDGDFSAGDLLMVSVLRSLQGKSLIARHPNLVAYVERGEARPAFKQAMADHLAGFTGSPPPGFAAPTQKGEGQ
jgi:glutathione S-transferase